MSDRYVVGISERSFSCTAGDLIVTHALGSCVGVAIHDPVAKVGGILHYMLPLSSLDLAKAQANPFMFGDSGIPAFFQEAAEGKISDIKILATDISTRVLRSCQAGRYDESRLKTVPDASRRRWFRKDDDEFVVTPELRAPLRFSRLNLMESPYPMKGPFDVIFCRNVMIYFDKDGRTKFVKEAMRLLAPGGILVVGSSESLAGIAVGMETLMPSVYRKGMKLATGTSSASPSEASVALPETSS